MENKITYPLAIVIAAVILAGGFWMVQSGKQASIEKQAAQKEIAARAAASTRQILVDSCIAEAEDAYWSYMELNGTGKRATGVNAAMRFWEYADNNKKAAVDICFKKY